MLDVDRGSGVLVALHGHGDEPASARAWARRIAPPGWEVVAPGAPRGEGDERSWFGSGPAGVDGRELAAAARQVGDVVQRVRASARPVVVAGFSQGGALALTLAAHGVEPDAVVALCAWIPEVAEGAGAASDPPAGGCPTLVLGGRDDEVVPSFMGEDAAAHLSAVGRSVTSDVLPGGHEVTDEMARRAEAWIVGAVRGGPRISLGLPTERVLAGEELVSGAAVAELALHFEQCGFDALYVTDHPAPDQRWLDAGGHHSLEPTAALSAAATATRTILLHTNVYVLPYRNPFLAAKALATVDVLSAGRLIVGTAAGYLRPEFDALGVSFDDRGPRLEDALELLPRIWSGETVTADGAGWSARGATVLPRPVQRPHPPLWVGGNSVAAVRRAVRHAQGWSPFPTPAGSGRGLKTTEIADMATFRERLAGARQMCADAKRTEPLTICFAPFSTPAFLADPDRGLGPLIDEISELAEVGVDWVVMSVPGLTRAEVRDRASQLAEALGLR
jgi:probable F420-dependent oxidoreductase